MDIADKNISDKQWDLIEPIIEEMPRRPDGKSWPWRKSREVFNGILWVLPTGSQWYALPDEYPPYQTCHRRFQKWVQEGEMDDILITL